MTWYCCATMMRGSAGLRSSATKIPRLSRPPARRYVDHHLGDGFIEDAAIEFQHEFITQQVERHLL